MLAPSARNDPLKEKSPGDAKKQRTEQPQVRTWPRIPKKTAQNEKYHGDSAYRREVSRHH
jgi:hypothetical protein